MMEFIKHDTKFNFASKFSLASVLSFIAVALSLFLFFTKMQYGVDFRGGAELQIKFHDEVSVEKIRGSLKSSGFSDVIVQTIGEPANHEVLLKVQGGEDKLNEITEQVRMSLEKNFAGTGLEIRKVDIVGPKAGEQLRLSGFQAMLWALIAIMIYVGLRFDFKYSPGAIIALFHDVSIVLGIFALSGTQFTLQTVAALLAVIGYSVNDTVIVYDRVREHEEKYPQRGLAENINVAINETLSRTILTSGTTLFVSVTMFFFGGLAIRDFFLAVTIGVFVGTYSSIFVAAPITILFSKFTDKKTSTSASTVASS